MLVDDGVLMRMERFEVEGKGGVLEEEMKWELSP